MHNLFEFLFELLGPGLIVRAHYCAYVLGAIADGGMREHVINCQFPCLALVGVSMVLHLVTGVFDAVLPPSDALLLSVRFALGGYFWCSAVFPSGSTCVVPR